MIKVFIDGSSGTTGLRIRERLSERNDIELISVPYELRHDPAVRREAMVSADAVFLCLPDAAAKEAAELIRGTKVIVIDTSTAHRTDPAWTYGLAELAGQRKKIQDSLLIANPGCHATGFITLVQPLVSSGILRKDAKLDCFSLTGYSGGGKKMIAEYEAEDRSPLLKAPRMYALPQKHKHLKEMMLISGLENEPVFCPVVADFFSGMETVVTLHKDQLYGSLSEITACYRQLYKTPFVHFCENADENGFLSAGAYSGYDDLEITAVGNEDRITLVSRFDNLGKGACGAAIQNLNIVTGLAEDTGLIRKGESQ